MSSVPSAAIHDPALLHLRSSFPFYAPRCLRIRTKRGTIEPLVLNRAQMHIHERIEAQRETLGYVRALVLKGRQQGVSTYTEGRYYWKTSGSFGKSCYILCHEDAATQNLFDMAKRYHDHCPDVVKPHDKHNNEKRLEFDLLNSSYRVATARTKGAGRSSTFQYFHGSEIAFWPNARDHMAGIGQALPLERGTEAILESTGNGLGNLFHEMWQDAERELGDYTAIFVPWYWQPEYARAVPDDFVLDADEAEYMEAYGLTLEQMVWRRFKLRDEFKGDRALFDQEYPATPELAFMAGFRDAYIQPEVAALAAKTTVDDPVGPLLLGVDPAEFGNDATAIIFRQGRKAWGLQRHYQKEPMEVAGIIAHILNAQPVAKVFIDVIGIGSGIFSRLKEMGFSDRLVRVHAGESAIETDLYYNKRAEMWATLAEWLKDTPSDIPDDAGLRKDISAPGFRRDSKRRLVIESKESMRKRGVASPDAAEALMHTMAFPVADNELGGHQRIDPNRVTRRLW